MNMQTDAILDLIREWAVDHALEVPSDTSQTFADAGFDSLHSTELTFFLEDRLGFPIDEAVIWDKATFDAFAQYLVERCSSEKPDGAQASSDGDRPIAETADW